MASGNNMVFEWLRRDCALIKSRRFHLFEEISAEDLYYQSDRGVAALSGDFPDFLREFGLAQLFTDHGDAPMLSVYPLRQFRRHVCLDGSSYVGFGFRSGQSVYFDEKKLFEAGASEVFVVNRQRGKVLNDGFSNWIRESYDWVKSKYSATRWRQVLAGPAAFTAEQQRLVEARKLFGWTLVGFDAAGDAMVEIANRSTHSLPYLTIGVRDRSGVVLLGAVWLEVSRIGPGQTGLVSKDCYKDRISSDELVLFDLPEPIPEKRDLYWEFGPPD
jgi:hypothetical protein